MAHASRVQPNARDDAQFRADLFTFLDTKKDGAGLITWQQLKEFQLSSGRNVAIIGQNGIQRPRGLGLLGAVTILTTYRAKQSERPYDDRVGEDGYVRYKWKGVRGETWDNEALRQAMQFKLPLVWFRGVDTGVYEALYPVWIAGEEPSAMQFVLAFDEDVRDQWGGEIWLAPDLAARRRYAEASVKRRMHQPMFRARVLHAYDRQCALCRLKHVELLEAAHIREDSASGEPIVTNGISMCVIHHKAFDTAIIGIRPDYRIEVQPRVLEEEDGPTLKHALQGVHGEMLILPAQRKAHPDPALLEERYHRFLEAG